MFNSLLSLYENCPEGLELSLDLKNSRGGMLDTANVSRVDGVNLDGQRQ